jgi:hypothetical protein
MHHRIHTGTKYLLIFTCGVVTLALLIALGLLVTNQRITGAAGTPQTSGADTSYALTTETKTIDQSDLARRFTIRATYPVVSGLSTTANAKINGAITKLVTEELRDRTTDLQTADWPERGDTEFSFTLTAQFIDQQAAPKVRTLYVREEGYSGGAHGWHVIKTLTFDLVTGEIIPLEKLFADQQHYLTQLAPLAQTAVTTQLLSDEPLTDTDWISRGTAPTSENYGTFSITDDGLALVMQEYQVGPYAIGAQVVTIPYTDLTNIVDPRGPLGATIATK